MSTSLLTTLELSSTEVIWQGYLKQDWQCTYKVTLCRVHVMFIREGDMNMYNCNFTAQCCEAQHLGTCCEAAAVSVPRYNIVLKHLTNST